MNYRSLAHCLLRTCGLALAVGCDARGVSVGTEDLCVADSALELVGRQTPDVALSTCAQIGDNQLWDPGFEAPLVDDCTSDSFCQFPASEVTGWDTTGEAQVIEIWRDGHMGVPVQQGSQFLELDAESRDTVFQDVALPPGQLMYWSFLHRGRKGRERVELSIGPPDATVSQGVFSSDTDAWYPYSGLYSVGGNEPITRFALVSRSGLTEGNLVDATIFAPVD